MLLFYVCFYQPLRVDATLHYTDPLVALVILIQVLNVVCFRKVCGWFKIHFSVGVSMAACLLCMRAKES